MAKNKGTPIVILGMHRSGTSALAHMLHHVGISMGEQFIEPDEFNPEGYFEDEDFLGINKGIIGHVDGAWYNPPSLAKIKGGQKFDKIIAKVIAQKRQKARADSWGWKDPRTCITCWKYIEKIPDAKFIVIVRRLVDIKQSLNRTHGQLANWDKVIDDYYDSAEEFLQVYGNERMVVSFEEVVYEKYAKDTIKKILRFVGKSEQLTNKALSVIQLR